MSFFWFKIYEKEISDIIKSLNKANDAGNISVKMLKLMNSHIAPIISQLINLAFKEGVYPSLLKLAKHYKCLNQGQKQFQVITDQFHSCQISIRSLKRIYIVVYRVFFSKFN